MSDDLSPVGRPSVVRADGPILRSAEPLFASPVFTFAMPPNSGLLDEITSLRQRDPGIPRSVHGAGWHSGEDFFAQTGPACVELQQAIVAALHEATRRVAPTFRFDRWQLRCEGW